MSHYLGIYIGISGCKAVIFDESGRQISLTYREYNIISTHAGWSVLDTDEVIENAFR